MGSSTQPQPPQSSSIVLDAHGVYRWAYEFNLFTNPTIVFTILKIFLVMIAVLIVFMLVLLIPDLLNGYAGSEDVAGTLMAGGGLALLFIVLTIIGYAIYAFMQGGKYCVVFTMDEEGILHQQLPSQYKRAQVISWINILAGKMTGNWTQTGIGYTSQRSGLASDFKTVHSIQGIRHRGVIKVNEPLSKNQVYVEPGDYDFVFGYIVEHCPNATVKG